MFPSRSTRWLSTLVLLAAGLQATSGCTSVRSRHTPGIGPNNNMPRELSKTTLPTYTVEPPDILLINALRVVPRSPYHINTLDSLIIQASPTQPDQPIAGPYTVAPGGAIDFGYSYGSVNVAGLTIEDQELAAKMRLRK